MAGEVYSSEQFLDEPVRSRRPGSSAASAAQVSDTRVEKEESYEHTIRHSWPLIFGIAYLLALFYGFLTMVKTYEIDPTYGNWTLLQYQEDNLLGERCPAVDHGVAWKELKRKLLRCRRGQYYDPAHNTCFDCPADTPDTKVFNVFWETQSNCQHLVGNENLRFITHVMWSFIELADDGSVPPRFQYWSQEHIKDCILQLRMRCIKNLVALGGASNRDKFLGLKDPANLQRFKDSAMKVVEEFGFDGIDVDDETGNMIGTKQDWLKNQAPTVVTYLQALRTGLDTIRKPDEPRLILSWDEFPSSWDPPEPNNTNYPGCIIYQDGEDGWHRCYEPKISDIVDMVNVMIYNVNGGDWVYQTIMQKTLPEWASAAVPKNKLVLGACSGMGCVMSQPAGQEVFNAGNGSAFYRGTMLWSGTIDILYENSSCLSRMGRAGNYGVKLPFRPTIT
ncbi:hypothetical protein LEN26_002226 [Aphanomyces euteiches]|nr:hypothetical protein AeMF1_009010 [Aphanomyces euteiches]KAH9159649.1 hypothetical protein LEN26_002226 [Aphanomyces euteiches]KAH9184583.1 hypothetical protein AeNC1_013439 [Aphanomyces euteiches]